MRSETSCHIVRLRARSAVAAGLIVVLLVHFAMTILYLTPMNPVRLRLSSAVTWFMEPWFRQRWDLFAPEPVVASRYVWFACRYTDGSGRTIVESPWYDMTRPLVERKQRYKITPADRLHRAVQAATSLTFGMRRPLHDRLRKHPDAFQEMLERIDAADRRRSALGQHVLARLASAHCDAALGAGRTREVRCRVVTVSLPPFSRRREPDTASQARVHELPWWPYELVATL
jgi:hypothetical protein